MSSVTAYKFAATITSVAFPQSTTWTNPSYAGADDGNYTTANRTKSGTTYYLLCLNFGFTESDIPSGSSIVGIEAAIGRYETVNGTPGANDYVKDFEVKLRNAGSEVGANKASALSWPSSEDIATYGGAEDMWSTTLTEDDVLGSTFGIHLIATINLDGAVDHTAYVDYIKIRVHYEASGETYQPRPTSIGSMIIV